MGRTRIKICGVTLAQDATAAVAAGADAVGLIFAPSPRQVSLEDAARIADVIPPPVGRIGVFVDAPAEEVIAAIERCALTAVQLHGSETPEFCSALPVPVIKSLRVGTDFSWEGAEPYRGQAAALLLDTYSADKMGGTATTFSWRSVGEAPAWALVFVAGGLNPDNVAEAVRILRPFAVDVSSGVELSAGKKDHSAIERLCAAVRAAYLEDMR